MKKLMLRPISAEEFIAWKIPTMENYARDKQKEGLSEADAKAESERSFNMLLPANENTPDHFIYSVVEEELGPPVGTLWWGQRKHGEQPFSWIYDIVVKPEYRGRGYGKQTMQLAMADVKAKGIHGLGLHVFGHNEIAQNLYRSLGFRITNIVMQINL